MSIFYVFRYFPLRPTCLQLYATLTHNATNNSVYNPKNTQAAPFGRGLCVFNYSKLYKYVFIPLVASMGKAASPEVACLPKTQRVFLQNQNHMLAACRVRAFQQIPILASSLHHRLGR